MWLITEFSLSDASSIANVLIAIATWLLLWLALRGLDSWKQNIQSAEILEKKKCARRLHGAALRLCKDISQIRAHLVTSTEIEEGVALMQGTEYLRQPHQYYVALLDRRMAQLWAVWEEAMIFYPNEVFEKIRELSVTAKYFRDSYSRYHLSAVVGTGVIYPSDQVEHEIAKLKLVVNAPTGGESDAFGARLEKNLSAMIDRLNSDLVAQIG